LTNSTLSGNHADSWVGGGIFNFDYYGGRTTAGNTIIAGNTSPRGPDVFGTVGSNGYNLIGNGSGSSGFGATDLVGLDPRLGPLAYYGSPTQTMALLPGSPAIDAGGNALAAAAGLTTDQRGFARIITARSISAPSRPNRSRPLSRSRARAAPTTAAPSPPRPRWPA
jgi:hypothetical protein